MKEILSQIECLMGLNPADLHHQLPHLRSRDNLFVLLSILGRFTGRHYSQGSTKNEHLHKAPGPRYRGNSVVVPQRSVPAPGVFCFFAEMDVIIADDYKCVVVSTYL